MVIKKQMQVLVSVGIIFTMMLHLAIPHAHHHHEEHNEIAHQHVKHHHSHPDSHTHDHSHEHDAGKDSGRMAFSFPAEKHLHAFHIHEFVHASKNRNLVLAEKTLPFHATVESTRSCLQVKNIQSYQVVFFKRIFYDNPFIVHCSLRAPPATA